MKITFEKLLLIIIAGLLIFLIFTSGKDKGLYNFLKKENKQLSIQIDSLEVMINESFERIRLIDSTIVINKNFYIKQDEIINEIKTDSAAVKLIRSQLDKLLPARFD